ncbi:MAG: AAA family ATPase, partial [Planctomycetota bacterium]
TLLIRSLSEAVHLDFSRIQFTPDLMPADILGTNVLTEDGEGHRRFVYQNGPIFGNLILADEINRATPKTQSALLEAMQERSVTVSGAAHALPDPFFVLATQNPIDMEGTYPLPEAQLDRFFFKIRVQPGSREEIVEILKQTTRTETRSVERVLTGKELRHFQKLVLEVPVAEHVFSYVAALVQATHPEHEEAAEVSKKYLRFGASPRGAQALILGSKALALWKGRFNASIEDVRSIALPALRHRILLSYEAEAQGIEPDRVVRQLLDEVAQP